MKIKFTKSKQAEEAPQKGFEEFMIDQDILDELDSLEEVNEEQKEAILDAKAEDIEQEAEIEIMEEKKDNPITDASSNEFINIIRENIDFCTKEIKDISETMEQIESQKNSESFWKKSENIRTLSKHVNKMSNVQQKTLDLLVMFLGASGKMAEDYDTIIKTIDELGELNGGQAEVLDYLLKVKRMIKEIKNNDERLKEIMYDNQKLKESVARLEQNYQSKVQSYEKNAKLTSSRVVRFHNRLNHQSFFIFLSYLLIIAIGIILYIKVF